jgi:hypothetical protein
MTTEPRANWEPRSILGWERPPAERACPWCRRNQYHTKAEHDLVYPAAKAQRDREAADREAREQGVFDAAVGLCIARGMEAEKAFDLCLHLEEGEGIDALLDEVRRRVPLKTEEPA